MLNRKFKMQEALESSAVLKMRLITLRERCPKSVIFAFEGVDDKSVYYHWIKQLASDLNYAPFLCGGKKNSLKLMNSLDRDVNGLRQDVYFFVDRDFDENIYDFSSVYVTSQYSFENYLARKEVLVEVLKNDFHFHGHPEIIDYVCNLYDQWELKFFEIVQELNLVLFVAAKLNIRRIDKLPDKIGYFANFSLNKIESKIGNIFDIVNLERNPTKQEFDDKRVAFNELNPRDSYRGKFNILFFKKFLILIYDELNNPANVVFKSITQEGLKPKLSLTLDTIASRSHAPKCFSKFIEVNFSTGKSKQLNYCSG